MAMILWRVAVELLCLTSAPNRKIRKHAEAYSASQRTVAKQLWRRLVRKIPKII